MTKEYNYPDSEPKMVQDAAATYSSGVTIPIILPSTGSYSVEDLKRELTNFAMKLLRSSAESAKVQTSDNGKVHTAWVQSMAKFRCLDPMDSKRAKLESLEERFG